MLDDTIAAIATPIGEGGLAVIRISGKHAFEIADRCFQSGGKPQVIPSGAPTHTLHFGHIVRGGSVVDEVLLAVMRAPRTFTRENVVEITSHGGVLPAKAVLDTILNCGARLAEPGEFTRRAFLNGRIDLAQAEAVADIIHSRTELALRAANEQLAGKLSAKIDALRDDFLKILAHVEAHIDFPDEDIAPDTKEQLEHRLEKGIAAMDELLRTANEGQILRRGIRAAIIGKPNAGKSSLLNQLLGHDRAIVSPVPGTTRDTIEEMANIRGLPVLFIDTAGLRESDDAIEKEGVRRSRKSLDQAEIILHVIDASEAVTNADQTYFSEFAHKKRILIGNKSDLPRHSSFVIRHSSFVPVSCVTGEGIDQLKDAIKDLVWSGGINAEMLHVAINSRHQDALSRGRAAAVRTLDALRSDQSLDLVALDLRIAVSAIGEVVGKTNTEDLLDMIFSQFCIGK